MQVQAWGSCVPDAIELLGCMSPWFKVHPKTLNTRPKYIPHLQSIVVYFIVQPTVVAHCAELTGISAVPSLTWKMTYTIKKLLDISKCPSYT